MKMSADISATMPYQNDNIEIRTNCGASDGEFFLVSPLAQLISKSAGTVHGQVQGDLLNLKALIY